MSAADRNPGDNDINAATLAGLDPKAVGADNLRRAVLAAMERLGLDAPGYLARLGADPVERRLLAGEAVVQESWLFRDPQAYADLVRMARELPADSRPIRVLSVPCAAGEEPASIAVSMLQAGFSPEEFQVDAADANPRALALARAGRFPLSSARGGCVPPSGYFLPDAPELSPQDMAVEAGGYTLNPAILSRIRFIEADVLDETFLAGEPPYQVIFCRHLLIYLAREARVRLAAALSRLLAPNGELFTTPAESAAFQELGLRPATRRLAAPAMPGAPLLPTATACPAAEAGSHKPGSRANANVHKPPASRPGAAARALADAGRLGEALALIDENLARHGPAAELYHLKGVVLLALGNDAEAETALRRAVYLEPGHLEALTHLEHLIRAKGRADEADRLCVRAERAANAPGPGPNAQTQASRP